MPRSTLPFAVVALLAGASGAEAQSTVGFGTCRWWSDQQRAAANPNNETKYGLELYRLGYAQGFVEGTGASTVAYFSVLNPDGVPRLAAVSRFGVTGLERLLDRPAVLVEAFDKHCSDYRNGALRLDDIGIVTVFELGGVRSSNIVGALDALREPGDVVLRRRRVLDALGKP